MANNKMLIDASHPEETRVVVVRGNRIEEFDFEAQDRRQLRGNIYLAKVTRVEPSLQAAFIDYGGNRHGFLAFSEIHPDYYQIPAADRQALLDAEAEAAFVGDDDNGVGIEEAASSGNEDDDNEDAPKKRRRKSRRGGRGRKSKEEREASSEDENASDDAEKKEAAGDDVKSADKADDASDEPKASEEDKSADQEAEEEAPKPKKRVRRPRKKKAETAESDATESSAGDENAEQAESGDADDTSTSGTMAAMMDMDVISEDAPDEEPAEEDTPSEEPVAEKPKRKPRARKTPKKAEKEAEAETDEAVAAESSEETTSEEAAEEKPKKRTRRKAPARKKVKAEDESEDTEETSDESAAPEAEVATESSDAEAEEKPKKRRSRRKSKSDKDEDKADAKGKSQDDSDDDESDENGKNIESVGQEDAMEEVSVRRPRRQYKIQEVVRRRQVMLVQVVKEERGNKGAALTTYLSLAGRYSVLMPNTARGGGISRKITNPADRKRLKEIAGSLEVPTGMGVILRTAGAAQDKEEIQRDFDYLMRLWENVRDLTLESSAPYLVYEEGSLIKRSIRDLYNKDIGEVIVAGEEGHREAKEFMQMLMPGHGRNVKLYEGEQSLLSKYNVESQLDKMVTPQVTLKSGGYLIINQTEALVAIDVNSGKSTREHSIEATALQTNLEAAEEVARQLRLRDLAGLVVIDFIDMEEKRNNRSVERKLKECLKNDRARIQVGHISHFGLLEMSRQRIRASVLESTMAVCPTCQGVGHVRSEPSFALQIVRAIDDHLNRNSRNDVVVKIPPSTAIYILNNKRAAVSELEDRYGVSIAFVSDATIEGQDFAIERGEPSTRKPRRKDAVNPMDSSGDGENETEAQSDDNGGEEERSGKRQRGRGRGRGRGRNRDRENSEQPNENAAADSAESPDEAKASETIEPVEATDTEEKPAKRGRGRGRKSKADKSAEAEAAPQPKAEEPFEPEAIAVEEEPKEPRRRTGRPGKKVRTPEEIAEAEAAKKAAVKADEAQERKGAPPREVKRRNTRRVKNSGPAVDGEGKDEPDSWSDGFLS